MTRVIRAAVAFTLTVVTAAAVLALVGFRIERVERTTFPVGVPGNTGHEFATTTKHLELSLQDRSKWVYPVATFVGVFGIGLAQIVLTHRARREAVPEAETDSEPEPPLP